MPDIRAHLRAVRNRPRSATGDATDERAAVEFPLAEQRALMGTTAFERAPVAPRLHQHDVRFVCGQSKGAIAVEFTELRDANECLGLHDRPSHRTTWFTPLPCCPP